MAGEGRRRFGTVCSVDLNLACCMAGCDAPIEKLLQLSDRSFLVPLASVPGMHMPGNPAIAAIGSVSAAGQCTALRRDLLHCDSC